MNLHSVRGFTLVEMVIVILVIGILASFAVPVFGKLKERTVAKEAKANLKLIAATEKIYKMERGAYTPCSCGSPSACNNPATGCNALLKLSLNNENWGYTVVADPLGLTFVAFAQRRILIGGNYCLYEIQPGYDEPYTRYAGCPDPPSTIPGPNP